MGGCCRVTATFEPTDLGDYTVELASNFRSALDKAGLRLTINAAALPQPVYVDRDMWEKIVLNLLSNAFKFTFAGEIGITVNVSSDRGRAEVSVHDTGTGIPPESCRTCSSVSAAWKERADDPSRAAGSGSRWCRSWSSGMAARSVYAASSAVAARLRSLFRSARRTCHKTGWRAAPAGLHPRARPGLS